MATINAAPLDRYREILAAALPRLRVDYGVASLGIFGSRVRGDHRAESDLDLLVSFDRVPGMLAYLSLEQELSDRLGVKVDLVMPDALDPRVADRVRAEVEPV